MRNIAARFFQLTNSSRKIGIFLVWAMGLSLLSVIATPNAAQATGVDNPSYSQVQTFNSQSSYVLFDLAYDYSDTATHSTVAVGRFETDITSGSNSTTGSSQGAGVVARLNSSGAVSSLVNIDSVTGQTTSGIQALAILPDGTLILGGYSGKVIAVNGSTYAVKWSYTNSNSIRKVLFSPSTNTVIALDNSNKVFALSNVNGALIWSSTAVPDTGNMPLGLDIAIDTATSTLYYAGNFSGSMHLLDSSNHSSPTMFSGGYSNVFLYAIDATNGARITGRTYTAYGVLEYPAIAFNSYTHELELWLNTYGSISFPTVGFNNTVSTSYISLVDGTTSDFGRLLLDRNTLAIQEARSYGASGGTRINRILVNPDNGHVFATGTYQGSFSMASYGDAVTLPTVDYARPFLLEVPQLIGDPIGASSINASLQNPLDSRAFSLAPNGSIELISSSLDTFSFNGTTIPAPPQNTPYSEFIVRYQAIRSTLNFPTIATDPNLFNGQLVSNQVLHATNHPLLMESGTAVNYQWMSDATSDGHFQDIGGQQLPYLMYGSSSIGLSFKVRVIASTIGGETTSITSAAIGPVLDIIPSILSLTQSHGVKAGGTRLVINGDHFDSVTSVRFGNHEAAIQSSDSRTVTVITPPSSAGAVGVTVTAHGISGALNPAYTYMDLPNLLSIAHGMDLNPNGGDTITVTGVFIQDAVASIDGHPLTQVGYSEDLTSISFTYLMPSHAAGAVDLTVTNEAGATTWSGGVVYAAPVVTPPTIPYVPPVVTPPTIPYVPPVVTPPTPTTDSTSTSSTTTTTTTPTPATVDNSILRVKSAPTITKSGSNLVCDIGSYEYGDASFAAAKPESIVAHLNINGVATQNQTITSGTTASWSIPTSPSPGIASCSVDVKQGKASITSNSLTRSSGLDAAKNTWTTAIATADSSLTKAKRDAVAANDALIKKLVASYSLQVKKANATYASKIATLKKQKLSQKVIATQTAALLKAKKASLAALAKWQTGQQSLIATTLQSSIAAADAAHTKAIADADSTYGTAIALGSGAFLLAP